jgi:hypothetical protein
MFSEVDEGVSEAATGTGSCTGADSGAGALTTTMSVNSTQGTVVEEGCSEAVISSSSTSSTNVFDTPRDMAKESLPFQPPNISGTKQIVHLPIVRSKSRSSG